MAPISQSPVSPQNPSNSQPQAILFLAGSQTPGVAPRKPLSFPRPTSPSATSGLTLLAQQHVDVGRDAQGSVGDVLEESGLALAEE